MFSNDSCMLLFKIKNRIGLKEKYTYKNKITYCLFFMHTNIAKLKNDSTLIDNNSIHLIIITIITMCWDYTMSTTYSQI